MSNRLPHGLKQAAREFRHEPTPTEARLWEVLRDRQVNGLKFRRQEVIPPYVVDFYCDAQKLIIEVDGGIHDFTQEADQIRQTALESRGLRVLRFRNEQVWSALDSVVQAIIEAIR